MKEERFFVVKTTWKNYKNQTIAIPLFLLLVSVLIFTCNSIKVFAANSIFADTQVNQSYKPQYFSNELIQVLINADDESIDIAEYHYL